MLNNKYLEKFNGNPGISDKLLLKLQLPKNIPLDYLDFIKVHNGGEGFVGKEYIILYKA